MLIQVLDAGGTPHWVVFQGQDQINDASGILGAGAVGENPEPQQILAANDERAGWLFQNTSPNPMFLLEIVAEEPAISSWLVNPGECFPPCGYPIPVGAISVFGSGTSVENDPFTAREWVNAAGE